MGANGNGEVDGGRDVGEVYRGRDGRGGDRSELDEEMSEESNEDDAGRVEKFRVLKVRGDIFENGQDGANEMEKVEDTQMQFDEECLNHIDIEPAEQTVADPERTGARSPEHVVGNWCKEPTSEKSKWRNPYICDLCEKDFVLMSSLRRHTDAHRGLIYSCPVCGTRYTQKSTLRRHMAKQKHVGEIGEGIFFSCYTGCP